MPSVVEQAEADEAAKKKPTPGKRIIPGVALAIIASTIALEGGYVRNPSDPGGETNFGITKATAETNGYHGPMRTLPRETAESIYYDQYMVAPGYEPLIPMDAPVTEELFDTTVNMGASRPSKWFEQSINEQCGTRLAVDGHVRSPVVAAYRACQTRLGAARLCVGTLNSLDSKQRAEYERLVRVNPKLRVFLRGWIANRIGNVDRRKCSEGR
jgi:lysozyme family protein